jgi:hypothetical protein
MCSCVQVHKIGVCEHLYIIIRIRIQFGNIIWHGLHPFYMRTYLCTLCVYMYCTLVCIRIFWVNIYYVKMKTSIHLKRKIYSKFIHQ